MVPPQYHHFSTDYTDGSRCVRGLDFLFDPVSRRGLPDGRPVAVGLWCDVFDVSVPVCGVCFQEVYPPPIDQEENGGEQGGRDEGEGSIRKEVVW